MENSIMEEMEEEVEEEEGEEEEEEEEQEEQEKEEEQEEEAEEEEGSALIKFNSLRLARRPKLMCQSFGRWFPSQGKTV